MINRKIYEKREDGSISGFALGFKMMVTLFTNLVLNQMHN